jgi:hypothetical protein
MTIGPEPINIIFFMSSLFGMTFNVPEFLILYYPLAKLMEVHGERRDQLSRQRRQLYLTAVGARHCRAIPDDKTYIAEQGFGSYLDKFSGYVCSVDALSHMLYALCRKSFSSLCEKYFFSYFFAFLIAAAANSRKSGWAFRGPDLNSG